ncbi:hypothetical protein NFI96_014187 [Prochilodus magdalenae]|nr:hypothetical protein NFI96_014187 [Prochilodus magdalenae]
MEETGDSVRKMEETEGSRRVKEMKGMKDTGDGMVPQGLPAGSMSSVNSPACLLARNHFYRTPSPTDKVKSGYSFSDNLKQPALGQVTVWVTMSSHKGVPGQETRGLVVNLILKSPAWPPPKS